MHPRNTRGCPLLLLRPRGYKLFINNVNSPGFLRPSLFGTGGAALRTDAVTCQCAHGNNIIKVDNLEFRCFIIKFWDGKSNEPGSIFSVVVHAPAHWEASRFLDMFLKDLSKHEVISLINSYYLSGKPFPWNTINTLHHSFMDP